MSPAKLLGVTLITLPYRLLIRTGLLVPPLANTGSLPVVLSVLPSFAFAICGVFLAVNFRTSLEISKFIWHSLLFHARYISENYLIFHPSTLSLLCINYPGVVAFTQSHIRMMVPSLSFTIGRFNSFCFLREFYSSAFMGECS